MKKNLLFIAGLVWLGFFSPTGWGQIISPRVQWKPIIEYDGNVFPSLLLATPEYRKQKTSSLYDNDSLGIFGVILDLPTPNTKVELTVQVDEILSAEKCERFYPHPGRYELFPMLHYNWKKLSEVAQPTPANVIFRLRVNDKPYGEIKRTVSIRAVNECPKAFKRFNGQLVDVSFLYAAYVNEDYQWIDGLLNETLKVGIVDSFQGYQADPREVEKQVFAIWNLFQRKGIKYSSIASTSSQSSKVASQYVRLFPETLRYQQANCIDGSVALASILEKIGLDTFLVLTPDHALVGFYSDSEHTQKRWLETTLLGSVKLAEFSEKKSTGKRSKNEASKASFHQALDQGFRLRKDYLGDNNYKEYFVKKLRKQGIKPLYIALK